VTMTNSATSAALVMIGASPVPSDASKARLTTSAPGVLRRPAPIGSCDGHCALLPAR
jgi:hypothetical protein